jgi:hypothetical protein
MEIFSCLSAYCCPSLLFCYFHDIFRISLARIIFRIRTGLLSICHQLLSLALWPGDLQRCCPTSSEFDFLLLLGPSQCMFSFSRCISERCVSDPSVFSMLWETMFARPTAGSVCTEASCRGARAWTWQFKGTVKTTVETSGQP